MCEKPLPQMPQNSNQNNQNIQIFKSSVNVKNDELSNKITLFGQAKCLIKENVSGNFNIVFKHEFQRNPFIVYNIFCDDDEDTIGHEIRNINNKSFTLKLINRTYSPKEITIHYKAESF